MVTRRNLLISGALGAGAIAAVGGTVALTFSQAMAAANARVDSGSQVIPTSFGSLEYADSGTGTPLLMIHGTGGGFDQGLGFCAPLLARGYRIIAPSRFGYLRSDFPADASSEAQADALVELLDHLGIDRLPVAGGSAGALPALAFAIRHPTRCSALIPIVPATYVPDRPRTPGPTGLQQTAMNAMLNSDLLFWLALNAAPDLMVGTLLATDPALLKTASAAERDRVSRILADILPVSRRSRGLLNDARLASNPDPMDLASITAPTLALSIEDDRFGTFAAATHIAATVPGARLVSWPTGGHVWVGHNEDLFAAVHDFIASL